MNATVKTNVTGLVVMVLAMYGVEVTPEQQTQLVAFFGGLGCVINIGLVIWTKRKSSKVSE
jgi:Mg2+ and Co2+ transporter CorA